VVPETSYTFDKVLGPSSTQADVYEAAVAPIITDVMNGINGTIMAYGQTGAGKTHTLSSIEPNNIGMMPRAAAEVFVQASSDPDHDYVVLMSYVQIYMELIQDLLRPESENLVIRENDSGVFISGAQEVQVKRMEDCLQLLQLGERNRAFAFTQLNAHSSRSHAIVLLTVVKRRKQAVGSPPSKEDCKVKVGKLFIVDLAGSERLKKSHSEGLRKREAKSINLSLTMLGMCINARADPNSQHVPFRDSKLTRLLQESLGGNAKTSLVLAAADVREHAEETQQSLYFGSRAMCVKTHPVINEQIDYQSAMSEVLTELERSQEDRSFALEATLQAKDLEMAQLQESMRREQERNMAIMRALEKEKRELAEARRHEAEQLEMMLRQKQQEIDKQHSKLQSSAAELRHRDQELSDRESRLEDLFNTVRDKDQLLREFNGDKERLVRELQMAKVELKTQQSNHDEEVQLLLQQWHAEKGVFSKQCKRADAELEAMRQQHQEEKAAFVGELESLREEHAREKEAFVGHWEAETHALGRLLMATAKSHTDTFASMGVAGGEGSRLYELSAAAVVDHAKLLEAVLSSRSGGKQKDSMEVRHEVGTAVSSMEAAVAARDKQLLEMWANGEARLRHELLASREESARHRETLVAMEGKAEEGHEKLQVLESRLEEELRAVREEATALKEKLKAAQVENHGFGQALKAAELKAERAAESARLEREALVQRWEEERRALERQRAAVEGQMKEQPVEYEKRFQALMSEVEKQRKSQGTSMAAMRNKLHAAEESMASIRAAAQKELQETTAKLEAHHLQRQQKMEELAERKRKRELRAAAQHHEAELAELAAKHRAEEESLMAQLQTALHERQAAAGEEHRQLSDRHAAEIRAIKKSFKAELTQAREAMARKHEEQVAQLKESHSREVADMHAGFNQREVELQQEAAAALARERDNFAAMLKEQHRNMSEAADASTGQERRMWETALAEKEKLLEVARAEAEQLAASERERLAEAVQKHQFAIQALKKHHKAEMARAQSAMAEKHSMEISSQQRSFHSELSNVSFSLHAEGSELAAQVSALREGMSDAQRSAASDRERLMVALEQQQEAVSALRREKDDLTARLHASESEVHNAKLQAETAKQRLEMEVQRLTAEQELCKERMRNQAALQRDSEAHKHELELQSLKDSLAHAQAALAAAKKEAEQQRQQMMADYNELHSKMDELQASAMAAQRRLEDSVEDMQATAEALQSDLEEVQVEKGLLLGSNKNLSERVEGLVGLVEEQKAEAVKKARAQEDLQQQRTKQLLEEHRQRLAELQAQLDAVKLEKAETEKEKMEVATHNMAASKIQGAFRKYKYGILFGAKSKTEEELAASRRRAEELDRHRMLMEAQRVSGMAQTAQQLAQHTFVVAQNTVNDVLSAFLLPKKDLQVAEKLIRSREKLTSGGASTAAPARPSPGVISSVSSPATTPRHTSVSLPPASSGSYSRRTSFGSRANVGGGGMGQESVGGSTPRAASQASSVTSSS